MINPPTKLAQSIRMVIRYFWLTGISRDHAVGDAANLLI